VFGVTAPSGFKVKPPMPVLTAPVSVAVIEPPKEFTPCPLSPVNPALAAGAVVVVVPVGVSVDGSVVVA